MEKDKALIISMKDIIGKMESECMKGISPDTFYTTFFKKMKELGYGIRTYNMERETIYKITYTMKYFNREDKECKEITKTNIQTPSESHILVSKGRTDIIKEALKNNDPESIKDQIKKTYEAKMVEVAKKPQYLKDKGIDKSHRRKNKKNGHKILAHPHWKSVSGPILRLELKEE